MRVLRPVVEILVPPVLNAWHNLLPRRSIAGKLVGDHDARRPALPLQQLAQQSLGCALITPALDQYVEHDAVLVDRAPQPVAWCPGGHRQLGCCRLADWEQGGYPNGMTTPACPSYAGHRFPAESISHAVWLYFRFPLSLRMIEEMLAARGILVSHESVRQWALKFGQTFANQIRRRLPCAGDK